MSFFSNIGDYFGSGKYKGDLQALGMKFGQVKPEVMLVTGGLSLLAGTILACTKTESAKKIVADTQENVKKVDEQLKLPSPESGIEVLPATIKQNKIEKGRQYVKIYGRFMYEMLKLYGIPALLWFGGMGFIVDGHVDLRKDNKALVAEVFAGTKALSEYRSRVAKAVGEDIEQKIFLGAQEGDVVVIENDPVSGEERYVTKKADEFYAQPGSIFAINFTEENTDIKFRTFTDEYIDDRVKMINQDLEWGLSRAYSGLEIYRKMGVTEFGLGNDENKLKMLLINGISGNAMKVPDPEMRKLKVTRLRGYQKRHDPVRNIDVWVPCLRLDFNFYPLEGKI